MPWMDSRGSSLDLPEKQGGGTEKRTMDYTGNPKYDSSTMKRMKKKKASSGVRCLGVASDDYYEKVDAFMAEICRRLFYARLQADVSIAELSKATGLTVAAIYKYEKTGRISMPTFAKVMFALQLEMDVIPLFDSGVTLGKEFECIVQDLDAKLRIKILNEVRSITNLVRS